jgi:hypothetical protein
MSFLLNVTKEPFLPSVVMRSVVTIWECTVRKSWNRNDVFDVDFDVADDVLSERSNFNEKNLFSVAKVVCWTSPSHSAKKVGLLIGSATFGQKPLARQSMEEDQP